MTHSASCFSSRWAACRPRHVDDDGVTVHYTDQLRVLDVNNASRWGFTDCQELIAANTVGSLP